MIQSRGCFHLRRAKYQSCTTLRGKIHCNKGRRAQTRKDPDFGRQGTCRVLPPPHRPRRTARRRWASLGCTFRSPRLSPTANVRFRCSTVWLRSCIRTCPVGTGKQRDTLPRVTRLFSAGLWAICNRCLRRHPRRRPNPLESTPRRRGDAPSTDR